MSVDEAMPTSTDRHSRTVRATGVGSAAVLAGSAASALFLALTAAPGGATGATLTVDSLGDGVASGSHCVDGTAGNCTLRDALAEAVDGDTIVFDAALAGVIALSSGPLSVTHGVTIGGPGADVLTVDAQRASRVFEIVGVSSAVAIEGLTITGGRSNPAFALERERSGGGVYAFNSAGSVTLSNLNIMGNTAVSGLGGGVFASGSGDVTIVDCLISGNTTESGRAGGAFITNFSQSGSILVRNTTIAGNSANDAGGLYVQTPRPVEIANSTIVGNHATTGQGGGVLTYGSPNVRIDQSTITDNSAATNGGGVAFELSTTVTGTIIWGNTSGTAGREDLASYSGRAITVTSEGSLFGSIAPQVTLSGTPNLTGVDPMLDPAGLAMHGGATPTIALLAGSPAIGAGPNPVATFPGNTYDQRGPGYPRVVGGQVDIGAFEFGAAPPPPTTTTTATPGGDPVVPTFTG